MTLVYPKTCIFCGIGTPTKEHVWGKWLRPYIPYDIPKYDSALFNQDVGMPDSQTLQVKIKGGDPRNLTVKCVCEVCNNGWMSRLQASVRDIVTPMALGYKRSLSADDLMILAKWSTMVSMTSDYAHPETVSVSRREREFFHRYNCPPPTFRIFASRLPLGQWKPTWVRYCMELSDDSGAAQETDSGSPNTQASTHVIGELFLHIISCPSYRVVHDWNGISLSSGSPFIQVWPPSVSSVHWPLVNTITGDMADMIAGAFAASFGLKIQSYQKP